jgi:chromate transporter
MKMANLLHIFWVFFRIGLVGFGGGYAILSFIMREASSLGITIQQFANLTALDLVVPGPIAINSATYVGYLNNGVAGATAATLGICAPVFVIVPTTMYFLERFKRSKLLQSMLAFIRPAAIGMIAAASMTIAGSAIIAEDVKGMQFFGAFLGTPAAAVSFPALLVFILTAIALIRFKVNPILVTILAGLAGYFLL